MPDRDKIVAVGLFTQAEYRLVDDKLRHIYLLEETHAFDDLLDAIDRADLEIQSKRGRQNER